MKIHLKITIIQILLILLITGCSFNKLFVHENKQIEYLEGKINVLMKVENYGDIKLELDADTAPITVTNFINLVNDGFYDGLTFHRIMSGFMIQGGDPSHDGTGGSDNMIKGEFKNNGIENNISHKRGVISMARRGGYPDTAETMNSATSQFFIMHEDNTGLDGNYAAFGHVIEGMEVVDKIATDAQPTDDNGTIPYENQPVITSISVIN